MNRLTKRVDFIQNYLAAIFSEDLHAKRVKSLANGTLGVMTSASLAVSIIEAASSPERLRHRSPDAARRRWRKPRHGSPSQGQHGQTPDPFAVPAGLYALRVDPEHAGGPPAAARRAVQRIHHPKQSLGSDLLGRMKMRGMAEELDPIRGTTGR